MTNLGSLLLKTGHVGEARASTRARGGSAQPLALKMILRVCSRLVNKRLDYGRGAPDASAART